MVLTVNNLSLPLKWTPMGPLLSTEDKFLEPIAWLVNPAVARQNSEFVDSLVRRDEVFIQTHFAVPLEPEEIEPEDRVRWRQLTGSELGEDVYMVGTTFLTHGVILPSQTLLGIFQALLKKRAEFPEPSFPWLFRSKPYYVTPTEGEEELVGKLEERAVAFKKLFSEKSVAETRAIEETLWRDLKAAGLLSRTYSKQKQLWLEEWGYYTLLTYHKDTMRFLNNMQNQLKPPISQNGAPKPPLDASVSVDQPLGLQYT
ncbi:MAG: hypothetical protein ACPGWR_14920 [Ardenticatenaceae bacterium]